jgi:hypothetical protein
MQSSARCFLLKLTDAGELEEGTLRHCCVLQVNEAFEELEDGNEDALKARMPCIAGVTSCSLYLPGPAVAASMPPACPMLPCSTC